MNRSNNHTHIIFVEGGKTKTISIGDLSHAGTFHDRGGLTKAGRALQKHSERLNTTFPKPIGNSAEVNLRGQKVLDEILNHPEKVIIFKTPKKLGLEVLDIIVPGKGGARFTKDGKQMIGLLEPK